LDDLVAPIALYPDPLLSQVLVASTYPLEVVEANQWLQNNRGLSGKALMDAARQQNWDASVQALVAFPDALNMLGGNAQWTTALGDAFLAQQPEVMAAVQRMRAQAQANGKLKSTPQEQVTTDVQGGQPAIEIMPADPQVVYVPTYDPAYIWGPPAWGYYPALDYGYWGYGFGPGINIGLCFGGWGGWGFGGWGWGWGPNWFGGSIFVNTGFFGRYGFRGGFRGGDFGRGFGGRGIWQHDPSHRLGVAYPNRQLAGRFGAASMASRAAMSRAGAGTSWNRFGAAGSAAQGFRNGAAQNFRNGGAQNRNGGVQNMTRGFQSGAGQTARGPAGNAGSWQRFQGAQRYAPPARSQAMPQQRYQAAPNAGARSYGYSGGARSYAGGGGVRSYSGGGAAPRSFGGFSGGGARSSGGSFGGGGGHFGGGGGGGHFGGGGGHGGGRR